MYYRDLLESRSAPLFHGTALIRAAKILESDSIGLTYNYKDIKISFSRSYEEAENLTEKINNYIAIFVVDQDALSRRYKIQPFHDQVWADDIGGADEQEEVVFGKIKKFSRYLISINASIESIDQYIKNPEEEMLDYFSTIRDGLNALHKLKVHPLLNKWYPRKTLIGRKRFENITPNSVIYTNLGWVWIEKIENDKVYFKSWKPNDYHLEWLRGWSKHSSWRPINEIIPQKTEISPPLYSNRLITK